MEKKFIATQVLLLLSHGAFSAQALPPKIPVTCENYQEANLENPEGYFTVPGGEVDCTVEANIAISYTTQVERINLEQYQQQEQEQEQHDYRRYSLEPKPIDEISQLDSLLASFIKYEPFRSFEPSQTLLHALPPKLPNMSYEETLAEIEGSSCLGDKNKWFFNTITNFRNWSYVEQDAFSRKIWFITDCDNQPAKLYIQNGDGIASAKSYTLPVIDHEFAYTPEYDNIAKVEYGLKDINPDGKTFSMERIDHVNYAYVTQGQHDYDIVTSQLTVNVFKNNKVYAIPQQRMISTDDNAFSRLSANGEHVVIASNYALKLYEYRKETDKFVLVGQYKYDQENYINESSLQLSDDGLQAFIKTRYYLSTDYDETYYKIKFIPIDTTKAS
jgi:hypothetical protein